MIGDAFRAKFVISRSEPSTTSLRSAGDPQLVDVFNALGGVTVEAGLYRIYSQQQAATSTAMVEDAMPEYRGRIDCFGADWLGCHFALDKARKDGDENLVVILEPGTGQALEVPVSVRSFHDTELVERAEDALVVSFYRAWRQASGDSAPLDEQTCVGYSTPLFLGGADDVTNLERSDMAVYWHLMGELRAATLPLETGTDISSIQIDD